MSVSSTDRTSLGRLSWVGSGETPGRWRIMLLLPTFTLKQEVQQNTSTFCNSNVWKLLLKRCVELEKALGSPCGMRGKLYAQRCLCQPTLSQPWPFWLLFHPLEQILLRTVWPASSMVGSPSVTISILFWCETRVVRSLIRNDGGDPWLGPAWISSVPFHFQKMRFGLNYGEH